MNKLLAFATLIIAIAIATPAAAECDHSLYGNPHRERAGMRPDDRGNQLEARFDRLGNRIDTDLARQMELIRQHFSRRADRAEALGKELLAERLHARGERIVRHLDRQGDRINTLLDRVDKRMEKRLHRGDSCQHDRRRDHLASRFDNCRQGPRCR